MLLSGIMLKMGLYGLMRWYLPVFPESIEYYKPIVLALSVAGVIYGAVIALRQQDLKRLIAFSSLSHVGLIAAGIFTLTLDGLQGAVLQMIVHGINVVGLFLAIEIIEKHTGSRNGWISQVQSLVYGGICYYRIGCYCCSNDQWISRRIFVAQKFV
jgi:NADH-quinone oxidoreductase subunit M